MREPDFAALYQALGDRGTQQRIRDGNPENRHCKFLLESPEACERLPESAGTEHAGRVCPNNPYENDWALFERVASAQPLLRQAHYLADLVELGLLPGPDELSPEDFLIARRMRRLAKLEEMRIRELASVRQIFGGGD